MCALLHKTSNVMAESSDFANVTSVPTLVPIITIMRNYYVEEGVYC